MRLHKELFVCEEEDKMAQCLSVVKEVLGLPASDATLLAEHDEHFFNDAPSESSSSDEDPLEEAMASHATSASAGHLESPHSSDEENLEDLNPAARSSASLNVGLDAGSAKRRKDAAPTTLEQIAVRIDEGCKCSGDKNCFKLLSPETLLSEKRMTEAVDGDMRESYIAGLLNVLSRHGATAHSGAVHAGQSRRCDTIEYAVQGVRVCRTVFLFANTCTRHTLNKVKSHLEAGCLVPREHASRGVSVWNLIPEEETIAAAQFIQNYAEVNGLPQPAAPRGHNGPAPTYLPTYTTKKMVHSLFLKSGGSMSYVSFTRIWTRACADIVIMKPREDVCGKCSDYQSRISRALTEEDRLSLTEALRTHVTTAMDARDFYRECIARGKTTNEEESEVLTYCHLTFDFAQQVTIPHHGRQVGPLYFRVPRRIQLFGIANEGVPVQHNYLVDEDQTIGKDTSKAHGPNAVVSMLHHHLETHTRKATSLGLHADNCCGQNKNKTVLAYLAWRVIVGLNSEIQLDFMRVGHTRCFVDAGFGLVKQKYRRADVDTVDQLVEVVNSSASMNVAVPFCWEWRAWEAFMKVHFRTVRNITFYQRYKFLSGKPGVVEMSMSDTLPDKSFTILSSPASALKADSLPPVLQPGGLSQDRAQYLFKEIRQFCHEESRDITCPAPQQAVQSVEE